jgi:thiol-disulfide isomerase/thioredoxin
MALLFLCEYPVVKWNREIYMPKPSRSFVFGCLSGVVLTLAISLGGTLGGMLLFKKPLMNILAKRLAKELKVPPITAGLKAVYDWEVTAPDGKVLKMADTAGKVVFLNFWQPDCPHCLSEIPALNQLYQSLSSDEVVFAAVAFDDKNPLAPEKVTEVVKDMDVLFPVYLLKGKRPEVYTTPSSPAVFIIAANGDVVFKHVGAAKWDDPAAVSFIQLLARKPKEAPAPAGS